MTLANILDKIIADKKAEVSSRRSQISLEHLKEQIRDKPKCRNFYKAVTGPSARGINVIAEVKKASPSAGLIREISSLLLTDRVQKAHQCALHRGAGAGVDQLALGDLRGSELNRAGQKAGGQKDHQPLGPGSTSGR